jgi:hypothetical protein
MNPESLNSSTAGGRVLWSTKPAPLLVLACCRALQKIPRTENKNQKEKPFTQNSLQNRLPPPVANLLHTLIFVQSVRFDP